MQLLMAEAWRNERLINHVRIALFSVAVVVGGVTTTLILGRPHAALFMMAVWLIFIAIFNATWFKRHFHPAVPWVLSTVEILLIGVGFFLSRSVVLANRPDLADRQLGLLPLAMMFLVSINMLRFSWRLSIFCAGFALALLVVLHALLGLLDGLVVPLVVLLLGLGGVLAYTTRRFERLLQRQAIDLRRIQRERIASLRSLVAGICHELNNPLGTLRSNAQISARSIELVNAGDPEKSRRALAALGSVAGSTEQATARLERMIASLRSFARLDEAEEKSADVRQMIDDAIALLPADLEKIEVTREYGDIPPITCRPAELSQVFMHVLRNSAQAGASRIAVGVRAADQELEITIADDGRGMTKEVRERIFDPTFSSEGGRVKMGFGLSASLGIVEDHRGRLEIESAPDRGTTVRVAIPA